MTVSSGTARVDGTTARAVPLKVVVAGGFGVGKTTLVRTVSEIPPLLTEEPMTGASLGVDEPTAVPHQRTAGVAMDFGRITVDDALMLYLIGTPGQDRFWFMWDELTRGCVGAIVLVDLRRVEDCFAAVDFFENRQVPFLVAVNEFPGTDRYRVEAVGEALALAPDTPIVAMDARDPDSCRATLVALVEHAVRRAAGRPLAASGAVRGAAGRPDPV